MRFDEVAVPLSGIRAWAADLGRIHFVITHEDGATLTPEDRAEWKGYTATFKTYEGRHEPAVRIDGRWQTLDAAEAACRAAYRQMQVKI